MDQPPKLLEEFAVPTAGQWRQEVDRLLKGASFDRKMLTPISDGVTIRPIYSEADTRDIPWRDSLPGQAPFVRGDHAAGHAGRPWLVAQEVHAAPGETLNSAIKSALENGQTAVTISLAGDSRSLETISDWQQDRKSVV